MKWNTTAVMGHIVETVTTEADDIDTATEMASDLLEAMGYDLSAFDEVTTESER
jgi:hypothetical protein